MLVKATIVLHNMLQTHNQPFDAIPKNVPTILTKLTPDGQSGAPPRSGIVARDKFMELFVSPVGSVLWQEGIVNKGLATSNLM